MNVNFYLKKKGTERQLRENCPKDLDLRIVALVPKSTKLFSYGKYRYPFSLKYLLTCLYRVQNRKEHETLKGSGIDSAKVMIFFIQMFRNFDFNQESLEGNVFDLAININFSDETAEDEERLASKYPKLISLFKRVLDATMPNKQCEDIEGLTELIGHLRDLSSEITLLPPILVDGEAEHCKDEIETLLGLLNKKMSIESSEVAVANELKRGNSLEKRPENYLVYSRGNLPVFLVFF